MKGEMIPVVSCTMLKFKKKFKKLPLGCYCYPSFFSPPEFRHTGESNQLSPRKNQQILKALVLYWFIFVWLTLSIAGRCCHSAIRVWFTCDSLFNTVKLCMTHWNKNQEEKGNQHPSSEESVQHKHRWKLQLLSMHRFDCSGL